MINEEDLLMKQAEAQIAAANTGASANLSSVNQGNAMMEERETNMASEQLDLSQELQRIEHLLRGHIIKTGENGMPYWDETITEDCPPPLNEYGVRTIMKTISFYLNKLLFLHTL